MNDDESVQADFAARVDVVRDVFGLVTRLAAPLEPYNAVVIRAESLSRRYYRP